MIMKKTLFIAVFSILAASCGILFDTTTPEEEKALAESVSRSVSDMDFRIDVSTVLPMAGPAIQTFGEYFLEIRDGKVTSYLPFRGTSTIASFGGPSGIEFEDYPIKPKVSGQRKKDTPTRIRFDAESGSDKWEVTIEIWDNGTASIDCNNAYKSPMRYQGNLRTSIEED